LLRPQTLARLGRSGRLSPEHRTSIDSLPITC
jgi:hypothetical protein